MKQKEVMLAFVCGFVLPLVLLAMELHRQPEPVPTQQPTQTTAVQTVQEEKTLDVLTDDGTVKAMTMNDYLVGVVLGEMPASFSEEALKAQAVVARTYAAKRISQGSKHENADICTDSACCQHYRAVQAYLAQGGTQDTVDRITKVVADTKDLVLTYDGALIDATYFSCSGGSTEAAVAVWGSDVPYLQAVDSPGEEHAAYYTDEVSFTPSDFAAKLGIAAKGDPSEWFGSVRYTDGGGVETMTVCGVSYKGTELRTRLGLRSTAFTVRVDGDTILISTRGFGHRVGMSQYGAEAMAQQGSGFEEILAHYYQGTTLEQWEI